ncbi:hypothetical protein Hdeb2414_s1268g01001691 [Helianthus debilis subsp. tardiflorus]
MPAYGHHMEREYSAGSLSTKDGSGKLFVVVVDSGCRRMVVGGPNALSRICFNLICIFRCLTLDSFDLLLIVLNL